MSSLIVTVAEVEELKTHPNADALEIARILGWQIVVRKGEYQVGDRVVYFPPDTVLPQEVSDRFGVTKYLSKGRIRCARLRGEPSFGLAVRPDDPSWGVGQDVAAHYGAAKYQPPLRVSAGDAEVDHPLFTTYTEIENMRNFPAVFEPGEPVVLTEKIHGTNCRVGVIEGAWMAGSKGLRRKRPEGDAFAGSTYWYPFALPEVRGLLEALGAAHRQVILFGEVYGSKIQSLHYGHKGRLGFRAFDLLVDGVYLGWPELQARCAAHGVETVPVVAELPFALAQVRALSGGRTLVMDGDRDGEEGHLREGVVVRPLIERRHPAVGRVILKYVSDAYLFGDKTDFTDV